MIELTYRLAKKTDTTSIFDFMEENWGSKHPLIHVKEFFEFYYCTGAEINFAVAETQEDAPEIKAICGYIPCNKACTDIWVSIWCAKKEKGSMGTGLELMSKMPELTGATVVSCNNIRPKTMGFYHLLGYTAERMPHYYMLGNHTDFKVARVNNTPVTTPVTVTTISTKLISTEAELQGLVFGETLVPHKDTWHIARRYFDFPFKTYQVYTCTMADKNAVIVFDKVLVGDTVILRIVDYIGDQNIFRRLYTFFDNLLVECNAEYIDCYMYGYGADVFADAGFAERLENDENIIPNYLEPPLYENTEYYFFTSQKENFTMWKADGDQNRANIDI